MNNLSGDAELARKGDTAAFARLYSQVYKDLYHIALYSLRNSHDACDAVSDTVMDAFCSIGKLKDQNAFRSWIMKILYTKIKRRQKEYYKGGEEISENMFDSPDFDYLSVEVRDVLEKLDCESRLLLSLSLTEGYTSAEIADICGSKPSTIRSKLSRIKQQLRIELEE